MEIQYGREKEIHTRGSETSQSKSPEVDFVLETVEQMVKYHGISLVGQVFKLLHKLQKQSQDDDSINKRAFPLQRNRSGGVALRKSGTGAAPLDLALHRMVGALAQYRKRRII
jgi:hypothetical protein